MNHRCSKALEIIRSGRVSGAGLAARLRVSWRTAARLVATLRRQGHRISSVRQGRRWWYQVGNGAFDPCDTRLLKLSGFVRTGLRDGSVNHDHYLYGVPKVERAR